MFNRVSFFELYNSHSDNLRFQFKNCLVWLKQHVNCDQLKTSVTFRILFQEFCSLTWFFLEYKGHLTSTFYEKIIVSFYSLNFMERVVYLLHL